MTKFTITKNQLKTPLSIVAEAAQRGGTLSVLQNILFEKMGDTLAMIASDMQSQITTSIQLDGDEDFKFTVSAEKLKKIVASLPDDAVLQCTIGDKLAIKSGKSKFSVPVLPAADFPLMSIEGDAIEITLDQATIKEALQAVSFAMPSSDIRSYLNGTCLLGDGKAINVVATNGLILGFSSFDWETDTFKKTIPFGIVSRLSKLLTDGEFHIEFYPEKTLYRIGNVEMLTVTMDNRFVDYARVLPRREEFLTTNKSDFLAATQRASINANKMLHTIVKCEGNELTIICNSADGESSDSIEVQSGHDFEQAFNLEQLVSAVKSISSDNVRMSFVENAALRIDDGTDSHVAVVMPLRI